MVITSDIIKQINELYYTCRNYSQVSREIGCSPSTVKKYVDETYVPLADLPITIIDMAAYRERIEEFTLSPTALKNPNILQLTDKERAELISLKEELSV